jgi:hypothetical protein
MFLRKRLFKNKDRSVREYVQLVESRRINGKPRQIVVLTLGRTGEKDSKEKIEEIIQALLASSDRLALLDWEKDLKADWSKSFGLSLVFKRLWEESGLSSVFEEEFKELRTEFDAKEAVFNMTLNRLSEPCSKRGLDLWQQDWQ